jgi:ketosteroid isomerase-like protein
VKTFYMGLCGVAIAVAAVAAQSTLTDKDKEEIQNLSARYAQALGSCQAQEYAGLFTADGIFYSGFRGNIQGTGALVALVESEPQCKPGAARPPRPGGGAGAPALQFSALTQRAGGASGTVTLPNNGGVYEDVYAKTSAGWRFLNRSYYTPKELAAKTEGKVLAPQDVLDIQQLVARYPYYLDNGAEGGKALADLFVDDGVFVTPQATFSGREAILKMASGHRPGQGPAYVRNFATNVLLERTPDGARGKVYAVVIAIGENREPSSIFAGGHFDDTYVKTQQGWRFKRRQFTPNEGGPTTNVGKPTAAESR